jgi:cytoskeletal protein CcmA (bactofilin family)
MATQYTTLLKLALPTQGELSGAWGDVINNNITSMVEEAVAGLKTINTWSSNSAVLSTADGTTAESRAAILNLTDTTSDLTGAATLVCPTLSKVYIVKNGTGQTVTIKTSAGSGIAVSNGNTSIVYCDGTNVVEAVTGITGNLDVGGNLTVGGNATVTGTTTFNGGTLTLGDSAADNVVFGADVNSSIIPNTDDTYDLGSASQEWRDIYIDGTAYLDGINFNGTAVTSTATEVNILDGDTSASSVIVADADRVVLNDGGTMKQVAVTDLAAYFDDEITAMPNLITTAATTVGVLDSGSITSGFGTIDTGASAITTTGLISGGSLDIDDVVINGSNIGHTDDTDLITVANGIVTVAGEISVTTLDIGGTNVTASAADINLIDGITNGTVIASKALIADANIDITGGRNITITGELDAGSLDISGDVDVDGTLEADAITVNGTALATVIAGTTVTNATNSAHVLVTDNESTNEENLIAFVEGATSITGNVGLEMDGNFAYNPSTGTVSATVFKGNIDAVDGDFDGTLEADAITVGGTALASVIAGTTVANATLAASVTVTDSTANTNFPIVFHDESNALLDDTGALRYNPSTGELLVPKLTVAGTTTTVDTVTMNAANAIIFEGATADAHETTLTIVDPTADRTINLPNQSGTLPVLAAASNTAVTSTPEELNILDGATVVVGEINALDLGSTAVGTAIASKAVILDSNKDYTGIRNITTTGVVTVGSQLIMPDVTSAKILVADGTSYQEVAISGDITIANTGAVTIAATSVEGSMLNTNVISGQTELASGLALTDELLVSDGGTIKRMDVSVLTAVTDDNATALAIALG